MIELLIIKVAMKFQISAVQLGVAADRWRGGGDLRESGHDVDGRPADDEGGVARFGDDGQLGDVVDARGQPQLGHADFVLQFEVARRTRLGDEQQVVEEEQVPLLALKTLKKSKKKMIYLLINYSIWRSSCKARHADLNDNDNLVACQLIRFRDVEIQKLMDRPRFSVGSLGVRASPDTPFYRTFQTRISSINFQPIQFKQTSFCTAHHADSNKHQFMVNTII